MAEVISFTITVKMVPCPVLVKQEFEFLNIFCLHSKCLSEWNHILFALGVINLLHSFPQQISHQACDNWE